MTLLVATANPGKAKEVRALLEGVSVETLADYPDLVMPPETGATFGDNARLKAEFAARALGLPALADDSGLEVDVLEGAPGVYSARYAPGSDADRVQKLLGALLGVSDPERTARFRCALAFCPDGVQTEVVQGVCEGRIGHAPRGTGGFGYDPVFVLDSDSRTMAELSPQEKNVRSHRARALEQMRPTLLRYFSLVRKQGE